MYTLTIHVNMLYKTVYSQHEHHKYLGGLVSLSHVSKQNKCMLHLLTLGRPEYEASTWVHQEYFYYVVHLWSIVDLPFSAL